MAQTQAQSGTRLEVQGFRIEELLDAVRSGRVRVPRFQRRLRWTVQDDLRLFDSIHRNYPVGTLLFWERPAEAAQVSFGPVVLDAPKTSTALWVVDGQQRITSLAKTLLPAPPGGHSFEMAFDLLTERFVEWRAGLSDLAIPVRAAYDLSSVLSWVGERELPKDLQAVAFRLADRLRNYEIPAYIVKTDDDRVLREIFDRTNTSGKSMTKGEVFRALHISEAEPDVGFGWLERSVGDLGFGMPSGGDTLLYCVLASRGPDVFRDFRAEFTDSTAEHAAMRETAAALGRVRDFLRDYAQVPHFGLVPYQHQLVGLVRFFALYPEPEPMIRVLLRRWFWQTAETGGIPKRGNTGTLKATLVAIQPDDPFASVQRLLSLTSTVYTPFSIGTSYRWTEAGTRVAVCALAALRPLDLQTGDELDVTDAIERSGRDGLRAVVPHGRHLKLTTSLGNRVFWPTDGDGPEDVLRDGMPPLPTERLGSLGLSEQLVQMLRDEDDEGFLALRMERVRELTRTFLDARMDRDRPVRPPVGALL